MSKKVLIFMVIFSLMLIAGSLYIISIIDPGNKPKATVDAIDVTPGSVIVNERFTLHVTDGSSFTQENLQHKFTLLYFGFSYCPDICPATLQKLKAVTSLLSADELAQIQVIFVSIDPARDHDQELHRFVDEYGGDQMIALNGSEQELDKLAQALKVYHVKDSDSSDNYRIDHTSFIYLLNPKAELLVQFTQDSAASTIADKLRISMLADNLRH